MDFIDWTCDTCHGKTQGAGAISITYDEVHRAEADRKSWADRSNSENFMNWNPADALAQPQLGLWKVECDACAGECIGAYWIDLRQAATPEAVAHWTEHLSRKTWFTATNWASLVASVGETQPIRSRSAAA